MQPAPPGQLQTVNGSPPPCRPDEGSSGGNPEDGQGSEAGAAAASGAEQARGGPALSSFWGVASALTATVKAKTAEVLTAVQETDWRAELEAFQQVGAAPRRVGGG